MLPAILFFATSVSAQPIETAAADRTGKPGDDFNLSYALSLFERSKDVENFERALNDTTNHVNNLDLDKDGEVDYIRVVDNAEGDAHALVMQVPITDGGMQDVAVIELERPGADSAVLQIRGDEDLYGPDKVMEPFEEVPEHTRRAGPAPPDRFINVGINVWAWPCVRFIYAPGYALWVSPWGWHHYPLWWRPWRPLPWRDYWGWAVRYHRFCRAVLRVHTARAHNVYVGHRMSSATWQPAPSRPVIAPRPSGPRGVPSGGGMHRGGIGIGIRGGGGRGGGHHR